MGNFCRSRELIFPEALHFLSEQPQIVQEISRHITSPSASHKQHKHGESQPVMAKHSDNASKASKRVKPNAAGKNTASQSIPSFDEKALSALTEKIEKGFNKEKGPESAPKSQKQNKNSAKQKNANPASRANGIALGKKRDAEGNVKSGRDAERKSKPFDSAATGSASARDILLQEILALGGNEEDLELLDGVESDNDDIEGESQQASQDPKFAKDLSKFIASLGIEGQANAEPAESEADEPESDAESEEWEDESVAASEKAAEPIPELVQLPEKKQQKQSNDPNRLVSSPSHVKRSTQLTEM